MASSGFPMQPRILLALTRINSSISIRFLLAPPQLRRAGADAIGWSVATNPKIAEPKAMPMPQTFCFLTQSTSGCRKRNVNFCRSHFCYLNSF